MPKSQPFQEAGLLRGQGFFFNVPAVALDAVFCSSILRLVLGVLRVSIGGGFVRVGGGFMEVQSGAEGECLVAAVTDKPMELADTATKVCLTPDLEGRRRLNADPKNRWRDTISE